MEQNLYDMWIWTSAGIFDMVLAEGGVSMKKTTREQCEEVIAARVEWLVTRWQAEKTQEEKKSRPQAERTDGPLDEGNYQGAEGCHRGLH